MSITKARHYPNPSEADLKAIRETRAAYEERVSPRPTVFEVPLPFGMRRWQADKPDDADDAE